MFLGSRWTLSISPRSFHLAISSSQNIPHSASPALFEGPPFAADLANADALFNRRMIESSRDLLARSNDLNADRF